MPRSTAEARPLSVLLLLAFVGYCAATVCEPSDDHPQFGNSGDCGGNSTISDSLTCLLQCDLGYGLVSGDLSRQCLANGELSPITAVCAACPQGEACVACPADGDVCTDCPGLIDPATGHCCYRDEFFDGMGCVDCAIFGSLCEGCNSTACTDCHAQLTDGFCCTFQSYFNGTNCRLCDHAFGNNCAYCDAAGCIDCYSGEGNIDASTGQCCPPAQVYDPKTDSCVECTSGHCCSHDEFFDGVECIDCGIFGSLCEGCNSTACTVCHAQLTDGFCCTFQSFFNGTDCKLCDHAFGKNCAYCDAAGCTDCYSGEGNVDPSNGQCCPPAHVYDTETDACVACTGQCCFHGEFYDGEECVDCEIFGSLCEGCDGTACTDCHAQLTGGFCCTFQSFFNGTNCRLCAHVFGGGCAYCDADGCTSCFSDEGNVDPASGQCCPPGKSHDIETDTCVVSACFDNVLNGVETGVDCGGPDCPACGSNDDGTDDGGDDDELGGNDDKSPAASFLSRSPALSLLLLMACLLLA